MSVTRTPAPPLKPEQMPLFPSLETSPPQPLRQPVLATEGTEPPRKEQSWVRADSLTVVGIDPGWANQGMVAIRQVQGQPIQLLAVKMLHTEKDKGKKAKQLRVNVDDARRMRELWDGMDAFLRGIGGVNAIGVEAYAPFKAQGGNSWKSSMAYAMVHGYAHHANVVVQPFLPLDLKKAYGLAKGASKEEVGREVCNKIPGLRQALESYAEGKWEHLTDAGGHAYLALLEIYRLRKLTGVMV